MKTNMMLTNYTTNFNKIDLGILTIVLIELIRKNRASLTSNLKSLQLILKLRSIINLGSGKIVITRPDLMQEILEFSKKEILSHKYKYLFDIANIRIYTFQSNYLLYLVDLFLLALITGLKKLYRMINRFIYNWLNIILSKSDFLIWFKYFLKKLVYRFVLKEEIQHSRWIKNAKTSIDLPKLAPFKNPIDGSLRDDGIIITEED